MRLDGRASDELRAVEMILGYQEFAEGSALIRLGRTQVLCAATVEEGVPPWVTSQGWLTAEYTMLPRSTRIRTPRQVSARETEIQQLVGRALRASLDLDALGRHTITIDCDVLQADGGTRTAAITGGYLALALALRQLERSHRVQHGIWHAPVAAISVGLVDGELLLDLCYEEDIRATVDCDVVLNADGHLVEVDAQAAVPFSQEQLERMLQLARPGIERLLAMQRQALGS